jgi:hypothetical protein
MATVLDDGPKEGLPSIKFTTVGQQVIGMVVDRKEVPLYAFDPSAKGNKGAQLVSKDTGKPRTQECITVIVMEKTTAVVRGDNGDAPPEVGSLVNLFIGKQHRWNYIQAKEAHGALNVGDVIKWKFTKTEPNSTPNPTKVTEIALRKPLGNEAPLAARAELEHKRSRGLVLDEPVSGHSVEADDGDDDGFI